MGSEKKGNEGEEQVKSWVCQIRQGNDDCFELLFKHYYQRLTRFAWRYVRSTAIAEELVQDLFAQLWVERRSLEITGTVQSYLYAAVRNRCLNLIKHEKIKEKYNRLWVSETMDSVSPPEDSGGLGQEQKREREILNEIRKVVEDLPRKQRMTYLLSRQDGLTYQEIAHLNGVSVKAVEKRMAKALETLRSRLSHLL